MEGAVGAAMRGEMATSDTAGARERFVAPQPVSQGQSSGNVIQAEEQQMTDEHQANNQSSDAETEGSGASDVWTTAGPIQLPPVSDEPKKNQRSTRVHQQRKSKSDARNAMSRLGATSSTAAEPQSSDVVRPDVDFHGFMDAVNAAPV